MGIPPDPAPPRIRGKKQKFLPNYYYIVIFDKFKMCCYHWLGGVERKIEDAGREGCFKGSWDQAICFSSDNTTKIGRAWKWVDEEKGGKRTRRKKRSSICSEGTLERGRNMECSDAWRPCLQRTNLLYTGAPEVNEKRGIRPGATGGVADRKWRRDGVSSSRRGAGGASSRWQGPLLGRQLYPVSLNSKKSIVRACLSSCVCLITFIAANLATAKGSCEIPPFVPTLLEGDHGHWCCTGSVG